MKVHILDGGPRKNWNTGKMCESFAKGVSDSGCEVEIIRLFDLDYKGCRSCFLCKEKEGKFFGKCGFRDGITDVLEKVSKGDGVVFASPIYFADVTPELKAFMERLCFPFVLYDAAYSVIPPKKLEVATVYAMNVNENFFEEYVGAENKGPIGFFEQWISHIFTKPERVCAFNTYQFSSYDKYVADAWDETEKAKWRENQFPKDLQNAYEAGVRMVEKIKTK